MAEKLNPGQALRVIDEGLGARKAEANRIGEIIRLAEHIASFGTWEHEDPTTRISGYGYSGHGFMLRGTQYVPLEEYEDTSVALRQQFVNGKAMGSFRALSLLRKTKEKETTLAVLTHEQVAGPESLQSIKNLNSSEREAVAEMLQYIKDNQAAVPIPPEQQAEMDKR